MDLRFALAFCRRSYWRFERAFRVGSGEVGRRRRGRCFTLSRWMEETVSGECARPSSVSAMCSFGCEAMLISVCYIFELAGSKIPEFESFEVRCGNFAESCLSKSSTTSRRSNVNLRPLDQGTQYTPFTINSVRYIIDAEGPPDSKAALSMQPYPHIPHNVFELKPPYLRSGRRRR